MNPPAPASVSSAPPTSPARPPLYDAHNHLQDAWLAPHRDRVFADLAAIGLRRAVVNGTCESDWAEVAALARGHACVLPSFGLHPWDAGSRSPDWQQNLLAVLAATGRAASGPPTGALAKVGEIGLDRWILDSAQPDDPRLAGVRRAPLAEQTEVFLWQLALAADRNLPASIHCLQAWGPLRDLLARHPVPRCGFLLHAYGGSLELVEEFAGRGAYFSFNGYFLKETGRANRPGEPPGTPGAARTRRATRLDVFRRVPLDRLLVETDAPAMLLPPERRRYELPAAPDGSPVNHPANLEATYAALASLRGLAVADLAAAVEANFHRLFGAPAEC